MEGATGGAGMYHKILHEKKGGGGGGASLNPVENLWRWSFKLQTPAKKPKCFCKEKSTKIPPEMCADVVTSYKKRFISLLSNTTRYLCFLEDQILISLYDVQISL